MGANKFFFSQVRKGLNLIADYQFNNNLIDDANGYNLTGTDITYNNGNAVFNGVNSFANRNDTGGLFSFTDGVNDLPFRIETSVQFYDFNRNFHFLVAKRQGGATFREWQLYYDCSSSRFYIDLISDTSVNNYLRKAFILNMPQINTTYNIIVEYDGSKTFGGLNIYVNGVKGTFEQELGTYFGMSKTSSDLSLGVTQFSSNVANNFNGEIDYLKIYK